LTPQYLSSKGLTQQQFADLIGKTQGAVSQWLQGHSRISAENAVLIERATGGAVTKEELRPDIFGKPVKRGAAA
jgi:DNA-binding transcriptional regulator YdaS (Cro superfamily)